MRLPGKLLRWVGQWTIPATFIALPVASSAPEHRVPQVDPRLGKLEAFFLRYRCPEPHYTRDYLASADRNGIDYRLLPAISLVESTCGVFQRLNNHWGWNNAATGFESVASGIDHVTQQLAQGRPYRDRDLDGKLLSYNKRTSYRDQVKRIMREIENYSSVDWNIPNASAGY